MKKVLLGIITILLCIAMIPVTDAAKKTSKKTTTKTKTEEVVTEPAPEPEPEYKEGMVKVYVFEAGGCPYCEMELEYLKGLASYGEKFVIVKKELYVDHENWAHGADYDLGVTVATEFKEAGFSEASYSGTPFVVISDVYAATNYSEDLESYIDKAYEKGDKDVVKCIEDGNTDCINTAGKYDTLIIIGIFVVLIGGIAGLMFANKK